MILNLPSFFMIHDEYNSETRLILIENIVVMQNFHQLCYKDKL